MIGSVLGSRWARLVGELALVLAVVLAAILVLADTARSQPVNGNERNYLYRARFFKVVFLDGQLTGKAWKGSYATRTQMMLANFVVGGWLWYRGYDVDDFPEPQSPGWQAIGSGYPPVIMEARWSMLPFGVGAVLLLLLLGRLLAGPLAGLAASALCLATPTADAFLVRALSEPPLMFFILLSLLLACLGPRAGRGGSLPWRWAIPVGIALGLTPASKLTGFISLAVILAWLGLVLLATLLRRPPTSPRSPLPRSDRGAIARGGQGEGRPSPASSRPTLAWRAARGWLLALALSIVVFVLSDPYLYANPFQNTRSLFRQRSEEMADQQAEIFPEAALLHPGDRIEYLADATLFDRNSRVFQGVPLDAALALIGLAALATRSWRTWRRGGRLSVSLLALLAVVGYFAAIGVSIPLAWVNYALAPLLLRILLSGVGAVTLARLLVTLARWLVERAQPARPLANAAQASE